MRRFTEKVSKIKIKLYVVCGKTCVYTNTNTQTPRETPKAQCIPIRYMQHSLHPWTWQRRANSSGTGKDHEMARCADLLKINQYLTTFARRSPFFFGCWCGSSSGRGIKPHHSLPCSPSSGGGINSAQAEKQRKQSGEQTKKSCPGGRK